MILIAPISNVLIKYHIFKMKKRKTCKKQSCRVRPRLHPPPPHSAGARSTPRIIHGNELDKRLRRRRRRSSYGDGHERRRNRRPRTQSSCSSSRRLQSLSRLRLRPWLVCLWLVLCSHKLLFSLYCVKEWAYGKAIWEKCALELQWIYIIRKFLWIEVQLIAWVCENRCYWFQEKYK